MTHERADAPTHSDRPLRRRRRGLRRLLGASVRLCLCASVFACTDPRARPAPPSVQLFVGAGGIVISPGSIAVSAVVFDAEGVDSVHLWLKSQNPNLQGDSLFLFPDTTDVTQSVSWSVPSGIPSGTKITVGAKAWDVLGFMGEDSTVLTSQ